MALHHARCTFGSSATWAAQSCADAAQSKPAHELLVSLKVGSSLKGKLLNQQTEPLFPSVSAKSPTFVD
ncbi:hypothetical protein CBOM_08002 [Ceraceosorus bombacis]|uniref:Uncharacterized protein n=1 Tax=Ceraceosorus bombacis TaxID=401625 RepID=A0A0P1BJM1_9BASI|nr:hypothetical protein CBOM_08002 [Ceraceosorus bombacis]